MIEEKLIKRPRHANGWAEFLTQFQEAVLEGYLLPKKISGHGKPSFGSNFQIKIFKETPDDPLELLKDPKLKGGDLRELASKEFGIEVPSEIKAPASIKKYIKDKVSTPDSGEDSNTEEV